jgi:hypothetical protein
MNFVTRKKRDFVNAVKLILWVDARGEEEAFLRKIPPPPYF